MCRSVVDVHLILVDDHGRVLLAERAGTGYADGWIHVPGGKLENGETADEAAIREAREELGVEVDPVDVEFVTVVHHRSPQGETRVGFFFTTRTWTGQPVNAEPDKCAGLLWADPATLPDSTWPYSRAGLAQLGSGGAGKTVLARRLSGALGIPVVHLDALYYDADWRSRSPEEFAVVQRQALAADKVIVDGNYASSLPLRLVAADTVIVLDLPARTCLVGILRRRWRYRGGQYADGVFDRLSVEFARYVINYRRHTLPCVLGLIAQHAPAARVFRLTSRRDVEEPRLAWSASRDTAAGAGARSQRADGPWRCRKGTRGARTQPIGTDVFSA